MLRIHFKIHILCVLLGGVFLALEAKAQSPADVIQRDYYSSTLKAHLVLERYVPKGAMLFFGDSQIQGLELESIHPNAVNFGITGDTTAGLLHRLKQYDSLNIAETVVLESGVNDLGFGIRYDKKIVQNYGRMLGHLPKSLKIYVLGIFPVNEIINPEFTGYNRRIRAINRELSALCTKDSRCTFIDASDKLEKKDGNLFRVLLRPNDGAHLNDIGKSIVLEMMLSKLKTSQKKH